MSFLKRYLFGPLVAGLLLLSPIAILIFVLNFIYQNLVKPIADLSLLIVGNGNGWIGPVVTAVLAYTLGLIFHFWPVEALMKRFSYIRIISQIKSGGQRFPEVIFRSYGQGRYLKGIRMGISKTPVPGGQSPASLYAVWEPRPASIGGRLHWLEESEFEVTGRNGWELMAEIFIYGAKQD